MEEYKDDVEFGLELKWLFEIVGVKEVNIEWSCFDIQPRKYIKGKNTSIPRLNIANLSTVFSILFKDGTKISIADGEYGDLSCISVEE